MADYYVATTGNNTTGDGSIGTPWLTIDHGIKHSGHALAGGDTLWVRAGTYDEEINWSTSYPHGTNDSLRVTVSQYEAETVTLQPTGSPDRCLVITGNEYLTFNGLIFDGVNVSFDVVKLTVTGGGTYAHHINFIGCEIKNGPSNGILMTGPTGVNVLRNCLIHDNGTTTFHHGIYTTVKESLVEDCESYNNTGFGIHNYDEGTNAGLVSNNIYRRNKLYDNGSANGAAGIIVGSGTNNQVYNNLIWGNGAGVSIRYASSNSNKVYNNTIYANTRSPGSGYAITMTYTTNDIVRNNIFWGNTVNGFETGAGVSGLTDSNNSTTDPNFVSTTPADPDFLKIDATSTAVVDLGYDLEGVVDADFDGNARPQNLVWDIGAYEFVTAIPDVAPVNTIGNQTAVQSVASPITGISVVDVNADCLTVWLALEDGKGTLSGSTVGTATGTFV